MAHSKFADVRLRYHCACGYCGVREVDCGGELAIDHFVPHSAGGGEDNDNLVYACFRCNQYKSDFTPSVEDAKLGRRILHPLTDSLPEHYLLNAENGFLVPLSKTGRFHIDLLHLNRPALVQYRLNRLLVEKTMEQIEKLRKILGRKNSLIKLLKDSLGMS